MRILNLYFRILKSEDVKGQTPVTGVPAFSRLDEAYFAGIEAKQ